MSRTPSNMLPLGTLAPDFSLMEPLRGRPLGLSGVRGPLGTLVMFICNHCPYVQRVNAELVRLAPECQGQGIGVVAISANDARSYPEDAPPRMAETAQALAYPFPYLYDETQQVARAYDAACTPDFFLFDAGLKLVYRGRLDDSTPGNGRPVTGADLRAAINALCAGQVPRADQLPSVGCNIKWKKLA